MTTIMHVSRSSPREVFRKKGVLKNFAKCTEKYPCWSLLLNKVAGLKPATLLKERLQRMCFLVNLAKIFKNTVLYSAFSVAASVFLLKLRKTK